MVELVLLAALGAGTLGVVLWSKLVKSANAPLEALPPPERPKRAKRVPLSLGDRVLAWAAGKYRLRNEIDVVRGRYDGILVTITARPTGAMATHFECRAELAKPLGLGLDLAERRKSVDIGQDDSVVDPEFDACFRSQARHRDQARSLLAGEVASRLLRASEMDWEPRLDDRTLRFTASANTGEDGVRRAIDHLVETARAVTLARNNVKRPKVERHALELFQLLAKARGGRVSSRTDELELELEAGLLSVRFQSVGSSLEIQARLELARPLTIEVKVGLESERSRLDRWRHPDVRLGDETFDDRFVLRGAPEDEVRALFGERARAALAVLANRVSDLGVDSQRITAQVDHPLGELQELTELVDALSGLAEALSPRREHGVYR